MNVHTQDRRITAGTIHTMTLFELYDIIHDRLEHAQFHPNATARPKRISEIVDIDGVTQQCMVEIRKKLGLYRDDINDNADRPTFYGPDLQEVKE